MIEYRPFRNDDPPLLAEIWRSHVPLRALMQPMTAHHLEQCVLAKPYFDRAGLIVAVEDGRPVGFVHAGFGPDSTGNRLNFDVGIICMLMVAAHPERRAIQQELLNRAEDYLRGRGSLWLQSGSCMSVGPFYLGLYGGSAMSGICRSDVGSMEAFEAAGYRPWRDFSVMQRSLVGFRVPVDRQQMQNRRNYVTEMTYVNGSENWFQACVWSQTELTRFQVVPRTGGTPVAVALFWDVEPLAGSWGMHAMGLIDIQVDDSLRRQGVGTYLLGEALRQLRELNIVMVEAQVETGNETTRGLLDKLGFGFLEEAAALRKEIGQDPD